jgi:hypothetical protein
MLWCDAGVINRDQGLDEFETDQANLYMYLR